MRNHGIKMYDEMLWFHNETEKKNVFPTFFIICSITFVFISLYLFHHYSEKTKVNKEKLKSSFSLNFDQLEAFSENYKLIRVWLWIFYKITVSSCCLLTLLPLLQSVKKIVRQIPLPPLINVAGCQNVQFSIFFSFPAFTTLI